MKKRKNKPSVNINMKDYSKNKDQQYNGLNSKLEMKANTAACRLNVVEHTAHSGNDYFHWLSLEIICRILNYLPLKDILKLSSQSKQLQQGVSLYLKILKSIDFTEGELQGWMPASLDDDDLLHLIPRCKELQYIYGFHPYSISKRRQRGKRGLSIPGVLSALNYSTKLIGIEISNITLLGAVLQYFPPLKIIGTFRNRIPETPSENICRLTANPRVTSLHLTGVVISKLPKMDSVLYLYLNMVKILDAHPFSEFLAASLHTFVMSNCSGPKNALSYVPLLAGLAAAQSLNRLELGRVPFMGGLVQHIVEDSWRVNGFRRLASVLFSACKNALESDLGYLLITAADRLKELSIQPSLTKDSLFSALKMADVTFDNFKYLYLGYVDPKTESGEKLLFDVVDVPVESPAMITDNGMKAVGETFEFIKQIEVYNCPHLIQPCTWLSSAVSAWSFLQHLTLRRCHSVKLQDFSTFLSYLPRLEMLQLEYMFKEPPKGCSRVGLSAGTGLGVSSALVQNHGNDIIPNAADDDDDEDDDVEDDEEVEVNNNNQDEVDRVGNLNADNINFDVAEPPDPIPVPDIAGEEILVPAVSGLGGEEHNMELGELSISKIENSEAKNTEIEECNKRQRNMACDGQNETPEASNQNASSNHVVSTDIDLCLFDDVRDRKLKDIDYETIPGSSFADQSDICNIKRNTEASSHDLSQPGCSHWNTNEASNSHGPKTNNTENIKRSSKRKSSDLQDQVKRRVKSVKIISVKCQSPPLKPIDNNDPKTPDETNSHQTSDTSHNDYYLFRKPPPKYTDALGENSKYGDLTGIPPSEYPDLPDCVLDMSPPDYNTAMAHGNVLDISPCSCITIDGAPSNTINAPSNTNSCASNTNSSASSTINARSTIRTSNSAPSSTKSSPSNTNSAPSNTFSAPSQDGAPSNENGVPSNTGSSVYSDNSVPASSNSISQETESCKLTNNPSTDSTSTCETASLDTVMKESTSSGNCCANQKLDEDAGNNKGKSLSGKKKGLVKRPRRSASFSGIESYYSDKSCQVVSEEIREETLKAQQEQKCKKKGGTTRKASASTSKRSLRSQDGDLEGNNTETKKSYRRSSNAILKRRQSVHHKSTSTSDPVKEDDHVQVLLLRSDSLVSVKLHMVGITDLIVEDCPELTFINVGACRVLKKVTIYSAPKLAKTQFVQCCKLDQTHLVNEVCDQISEKNRTIFLRPMHEFDQREFESMLFKQPDICYYLCIVYDYSPCPSQTLYNRMRITNWMDLFSRMNIDLLRALDFVETSWYRMDANKYPWKRDIYRMQGLNNNGSEWQIITDVPWIRLLSQCPDVNHPKQHLDDKKAGIYCRAAKGHYTKEDALDALTLELAEFKASNQTFFCNSIVVYFNMCDRSGQPTPDIYM